MTIYGDGSHTRSFQYVHDLVDGLIDTMNGGCTEPMNLGNPSEFTISKFAELVKARIKSRSKIVNLDAKEDDPRQRRPDISKAWDQIGWIPRFSLEQGLDETIEYFTHALEND
jgi:UDP-glucuronate decarboxylase